jgi:hypothetical protein
MFEHADAINEVERLGPECLDQLQGVRGDDPYRVARRTIRVADMVQTRNDNRRRAGRHERQCGYAFRISADFQNALAPKRGKSAEFFERCMLTDRFDRKRFRHEPNPL